MHFISSEIQDLSLYIYKYLHKSLLYDKKEKHNDGEKTLMQVYNGLLTPF